VVLYLLENYRSTQVTTDGVREKLANGGISDQALAWAPDGGPLPSLPQPSRYFQPPGTP